MPCCILSDVSTIQRYRKTVDSIGEKSKLKVEMRQWTIFNHVRSEMMGVAE